LIEKEPNDEDQLLEEAESGDEEDEDRIVRKLQVQFIRTD
jgi:hypothetical protein